MQLQSLQPFEKHVGDLASIGAVVSFWLAAIAHWAQPLQIILGALATLASLAWFIPRAIDQWLSLLDHIEKRKKTRDQ